MAREQGGAPEGERAPGPTQRVAGDLAVRLRPPNGVLEIAERLERAGHETWCVGGAVRDALLRHPSLDWDLATAATPDVVRALFRRTVPKGIEFGTVGVFDRGGVMHEVTTFRRDVRTDGRHAVVEFGASLDDDLARRDFTINAIAFSPARGVLHDPFDGVGDLARRVVRAVGDPPTRLREDRLRALRAIRFAGRFGFAIEPATWTAILDSAPHLGRLSPERVREELEKTMVQVARPSEALERWRAAGALGALVPALAEQPAVAFATADHLPRPGLANRPQRLWNRLAALWLGLDRATVEAGLRALRASNQQTRWIADLADRWPALDRGLRDGLRDAHGTRTRPAARPDDATFRRWAAATGRTLLPAVYRVAAARLAAERAAGVRVPEAAALRATYRRAVRIAYRDPIAVGDLAVGGSDLVDAGVPPGPAVGKILARLLALVLDDPSQNRRDALLARVPTLLAQASDAAADHDAPGDAARG